MRPWPRRRYRCGCRCRCGRRLVRVRVQVRPWPQHGYGCRCGRRCGCRRRCGSGCRRGRERWCGHGRGCGRRCERGLAKMLFARVRVRRDAAILSRGRRRFAMPPCRVFVASICRPARNSTSALGIAWLARYTGRSALLAGEAWRGATRAFATFLQMKAGLRFRAGRERGLRRTRRTR